MINLFDSVFVAGAVSSAIATPTDVLKVRMQVHGRGMSDQMGLAGCFRQIYQQEGISGLWRVCLHAFLQCQICQLANVVVVFR